MRAHNKLADLSALVQLFTLLLYELLLFVAPLWAIAPTIDYSHNMRILKLPKSVRPGELVYRLRGSDADPNSQLHFGVSGIEGRTLLDIVEVPNSWNEADVYLRSPLLAAAAAAPGVRNSGVGASTAPGGEGAAHADQRLNSLLSNYHHQLQGETRLQQQQLPVFNLTIFVSDGNKSTQVESTLIVTDDDELERQVGAPAASYESSALHAITSNRSASPATALNHHNSYLGNSHLESEQIVANVNITTTISGSHPTSLGADFSPLRQPTVEPAAAAAPMLLLSPFIRPRHVFSVPENTAPGESLGWLSVRENEHSDLPVRFELRGQGADSFAIKYVFGPRGQSRAELLLAQPVDFEKQNLFSLKVLALNAWTNTRYDTRNVATLDIVISVADVQDTAPKWRELPHLLRVPNDGQPGQLIGRVLAEDGDVGDQRAIQYALDASSPLVSYFAIDTTTGAIKLAKGAQELALAQHSASELLAPMLVVYASEKPDTRTFQHLWPPMFARAELPVLLVDVVNEAPRFLGGWQTQMLGPQAPLASVLHGYLRELPTGAASNQQLEHDDTAAPNAAAAAAAATSQLERARNKLAPTTSGAGQLVQWYTNSSALSEASADSGSLAHSLLAKTRGRPLVMDLGAGPNGTFELSLEGPDAHLFELEPQYAVTRLSLLNLMVASNANWSLFDAEHARASGHSGDQAARVFRVDVVARDFGSPVRLSSRVRCLIELLEVNDNAPQFESDLYTLQVYENAPPGQVIGSIRARDPDLRTGANGNQRVRYVALTGYEAHLFKLDQENGLISVSGQLDREHQAHYLLVAEARDANGGSASNYTKIIINVLDVNDNAPVFSQSHYDAVLLADGSFHQPLVVSASDSDERESANSQVAYEIIAGNQNDQFTIDALSGAIYATGLPPNAGGELNTNIQLPSILSEPILPFGRPNQARDQLDQHGKIKPAHEIEETTAANYQSQRQSQPQLGRGHHSSAPIIRLSENVHSSVRNNWPRQASEQQQQERRHGLRSIEATPTLVSPPESPMISLLEELPGGLDLLLNADAPDHGGHSSGNRHAVRSVAPTSTSGSTAQPASESSPVFTGKSGGGGFPASPASSFDAFKVAPITTLVVRAHDFGIPLRSATCKVNIYNQALLSRSISVILNGTAEQLEQRRELIERAFGALTASKAQIESIDALTDSSSISVARLKLAIPAGHSLIDLTDLSSLMQALDYKPGQHQAQPADFRQPNANSPPHSSGFSGTHYIAAGDRLYPVQPHQTGSVPLSNITSGGLGATGHLPAFYTDFGQFSFESSLLERKLLFYIIIVGICILALLIIWMIYFCCRETEQNQRRNTKTIETVGAQVDRKQRHQSGDSADSQRAARGRHLKRKTSTSKTQLIEEEAECDTEPDVGATRGRSGGGGGAGETKSSTQAKSMASWSNQSAIANNLAKRQNESSAQNFLSAQSAALAANPSDRISMYNGQVWFEQGGLRVRHEPAPASRPGPFERRASSAPSAGANSLDSSLRTALNTGRSSAFLSPANSSIMMHPMGAHAAAPGSRRFFPNTIGYMENLANIEDGGATPSGGLFGKSSSRRPHRGGKVVPMTLLNGNTKAAFENDLESGGSGATGLVLVPASSLTMAKELRRAQQTRVHSPSGGHKAKHSSHAVSAARHRHRDEAGSSSLRSASCTSSSSSSDATRTMGAESHESLVLDSDQELLGFDSTGTPIIATHTRRTTAGNGGTRITATRPLVSELAPSSTATGTRPEPEPEPTSVPLSSPTPTVIPATKKETVAGEKGDKLESAREQEGSLEKGKKDGATAGKKDEQAAPTKADEPEKKVDTFSSGVGDVSESKRAGVSKGPESLRNGQVSKTPTLNRESTIKSGDLMEELNERLAASNSQKQRALKRQSADENESRVPISSGPQQAPSSEAKRTSSMQKGDSAHGDEQPNEEARDELAQREKPTGVNGRRASGQSLSCQSSVSSIETTGGGGGGGGLERNKGANRLADMKNGELLEKQSIFALTYSGLATDKLPS